MSRKACYIFSSSPSQGASNIRDNASRFTVQMNYPLFIPNGSKNATCEVVQANIWNTSPNISPSFDNDMFVAYDGTNMIYIKIDKGLYDIQTLTAQLELQWDSYLASDGKTAAKISWANLFTITGNDSTQKVSIQFETDNKTDTYIDWKQSTIRDILGFDITSAQKPLVSKGSITAQYIADFNNLNAYYLHSDLVGQGIPTNSIYGQVISVIPVTAAPGNLIVYQGQYENLFADCDNLIGSINGRSTFSFWLTTENNQAIDMNGEEYSFTLMFKWDV
jgi:hypothetical protein